jgi:hypothetical protein
MRGDRHLYLTGGFASRRSARGRMLVMSHAERGTAIRIMSARPTTHRERAQHEDGEFQGGIVRAK